VKRKGEVAILLSTTLLVYTSPCFGDECCEQPVCCECNPCCAFDPDCVDIRCYTPPYYNLSGDCGRSFQAEFLWWYAKENNLAYTLEVDASLAATEMGLSYSPDEYEYLGTKFRPGLRIGSGWNSACDGWDGLATWTYTRNQKKDSTNTDFFFISDELPEFTALINPWTNPGFTFDGTPLIFDKMSAKWHLQFNQVDLEFGRKYWLSSAFTLRPYAGARAGWITTKFRVKALRDFTLDPDTDPELITFKDTFSTKTLGAGIIGGFQPNWYICNTFVFFANFQCALLWQRFNGSKKERYQAPELEEPINYSNSFRSVFYTMQTVWDLAAGFRWENTWCCDRFRTSLDVSWEQHIWLDFDQRTTFSNRKSIGANIYSFDHVDRITTDLMLGGAVARFRLDF